MSFELCATCNVELPFCDCYANGPVPPEQGSEPREWVCCGGSIYELGYEPKGYIEDAKIRLVQKSAYLAVCQERDSLAQEVIDMFEQLFAARRALDDSKQLREADNNRILELECERDEALQDRTSLEYVIEMVERAVSDTPTYADNCMSDLLERMNGLSDCDHSSAPEKLQNASLAARSFAEVLNETLERLILERKAKRKAKKETQR